nr:NAD-dependent epimerase/dehydratase family protein [Verrucomicrobiota bacterium]
MKRIETLAELEARLSAPTEGVLNTLRSLEGDLLVLGAGGKMGLSLARMAQRAGAAVGGKRRIFAVSRFSSANAADELRRHGVQPIACDLADREAVGHLPDAPHVIYMAGQKFGTSDTPELTWVMNTLVPAIVADRYARSRIVVFSTACVYPMTPATGPGSREGDPLGPPGEYASSCVGRERIFAHFSKANGTLALLFRLSYAIDLRYGVLLDVAQRVAHGLPVDVTTGWANVIWQGDANARAIECLAHTATPPRPLNVTGREKVSIRELAARFGELLGKQPAIVGTEAP